MKEKRKEKTKTEKNKGHKNYSERVRAKWLCFVFKLDFLQLICKASLSFKSNLELALSIILKERDLYESKHVVVECRCWKILNVFSFLICSSILVLRWRQDKIEKSKIFSTFEKIHRSFISNLNPRKPKFI